MSAPLILAAVALGAWVYLLLFRGWFWLFRERDTSPLRVISRRSPSVVAVVPARNEGDCIERALRSLAAQDYAGEFHIIVVDDQSTDDTVERIMDLRSPRIDAIQGSPRPAGWTGKLWALRQGIAAADAYEPEFLWLTDADIVHTPDNLSQLVMRAEAGGFTLVSLMAKLSCESASEKFLIPAFVFFFAMLFPFSWVNRPSGKTAAAAGGCMLVRRSALAAAGSIDCIRAEIIDDCALARRLKNEGPIWLGLTSRATSIRSYPRFGEIRAMVSRSAFAQLHYSWAMLVLTILGLGAIYLAPPLLVVFAGGVARIAAAFAWIFMALALTPILRFYGRSPLWGLALPAIAGCYAAFTLDSAVQFLRGRGGMWKGRAYPPSRPTPLRRDEDVVGRVGRLQPAAYPHPKIRAANLSFPPARQLRCCATAPTPQGGGRFSAHAMAPVNGGGKLSSGKTHRDENFPVASLLIAPQHRGIILAFYRFVREADDIADHAHASADEKLRLLDEMQRSLLGETGAIESGIRLREQLAQRGITNRHALDLLEAFRRDVTKLRYLDWDDLVDYCSVSAMPVGRFVLDVHGESPAIWPFNDALCAALQIINHLQDCGPDYRSLNRVYIPVDAFAAAGTTPEALAEAPASSQLRAAIRDVATRNQTLLERSSSFAQAIRDRRLSLEVSVIHRLASDLNRRLLVRDPLSERVHHGRAEATILGVSAVTRQLLIAGLRRKRTAMAEAR